MTSFALIEMIFAKGVNKMKTVILSKDIETAMFFKSSSQEKVEKAELGGWRIFFNIVVEDYTTSW